MRILFLAQILPYPLDAGPKLRAYYTLRHLATRHAITLVSFVRDSDRPEAIAHLEQFCERVVTVPMRRSRWRDGLALGRSLATGEPFLITRDWVPEMAERLTELVSATSHFPLLTSHFDFIHADQLWMAPYALAARAEAERRGYRPRLILDQHNAVHLIPRRLADGTRNPLLHLWLTIEANRMARYESGVCGQFDHVVWVTAEDRDAVRQLQNSDFRLPISTIPICTDPQTIAPISRRPEASPRQVMFLGGMHWPPNGDGVLWFAREVWPKVRELVPEACFLAVGKNPPRELQSRRGSLHQSIRAPGYVDDPRECWKASGVFVVPLRAGGGMRVKILDAWARGMPVVSTTIGAEGIAYRAGEDLLIADTPQEFAEAVAGVLTDGDLARRLAAAGRATVERQYDWRFIYKAWDDVYADA